MPGSREIHVEQTLSDDLQAASVPFSTKQSRVVSFRDEQSEKEVLKEAGKSSPGRLASVLKSSRGFKKVAQQSSESFKAEARDEQSTARGSRSESSRDPPSPAGVVVVYSPVSVRHRERRARDSFDSEDSGNFVVNTLEIFRFHKSLLPPPESNLQANGTSRGENTDTGSILKESEELSRKPVLFLKTPLLEKPNLTLCVDEVDDDVPLTKLENVTAYTRSLIPPELLNPPRPKRRNPILAATLSEKNKMATTVKVSSDNRMTKSRSFRKRLSRSSKTKKAENIDYGQDQDAPIPAQPAGKPKHRMEEQDPENTGRYRHSAHRPAPPLDEIPPVMSAGSEDTPVKSNRSERSPPSQPHGRGRGLVEKIRSASRSRSRSRSRKEMESHEDNKSILIAVTSCRSDAYHNQKAPGSTSKLPRKAPSNLKLFHELAVGLKDAYTAAGETPTRPNPEEWSKYMSPNEIAARTVLWEFVGNLDFLLALVDEVAIDTATRGALKDDTTFKSLRDVIKKCNKVLETMLVRRERKYTLFFRLVQPHDAKDIEQIQAWNQKVEKAVGAVAEGSGDEGTESETDIDSVTSSSTDASASSSIKGVFSRGRELLPTAGKVRARRATPTPRLRTRRDSEASSDSNAAEDGYSAVTSPLSRGNLAMLQRSLAAAESANSSTPGMNLSINGAKQELVPMKPMQPKDELVDVIRGLRMEKMKNKDGGADR